MVMLGTKWLASDRISSHCTNGISVSGLSYPSITSARREGATGSGQHMSRTPVIAHARSQGGSPMCSHSAPPLIMRLHSAVSWPKSEARTEGEMMARGIVEVQEVVEREGRGEGRLQVVVSKSERCGWETQTKV